MPTSMRNTLWASLALTPALAMALLPDGAPLATLDPALLLGLSWAVAIGALLGSRSTSRANPGKLQLLAANSPVTLPDCPSPAEIRRQLTPLLLALIPLALYAFLAHKYRRFFGMKAPAAWLILLPIGAVAWALVHASGIHATVAGVLLGFAVPVLRSQASGGPEAGPGLAEIFEHRFRPISAGFAVPIFAFFSAGVAVGGWDGLVSALTDPVAVGIIMALVLGKPIGIMGTTWLLTKVTKARLDTSFKWIDVFGVSLLAGIGFTVSLLVAELSFGQGSLHDDHAKVGILAASVLAALLAMLVLRTRNRQYREVQEAEKVDADQDGIPDVYQQDGPAR